jgi:hypothetical protein
MRRRTIPGITATLLLAAGGCAEGVSAAAGHSPRGDSSELVGEFTVRLTAANRATGAAARTTVFGVVKDGPEPPAIAWHVVDESDDCTLLEPEAPFCETPCGGRAVCTADDECTPYPTTKPVGTVALSGLGSHRLRLTPISGKYMPDTGVLPYPPCDEGDEVQLHADGGGYNPFARQTRCIAPLDFDASIELVRERDLRLEWSAPRDPQLARIEVKLDISHHGGAKGKIECDTTDDGELTIPSALIDRLVELGVAGFPTIALTRRARSSADAEPRGVSLSVLETVERPVAVPGILSCTGDEQCAGGQKCASDLTCQPG